MSWGADKNSLFRPYMLFAFIAVISLFYTEVALSAYPLMISGGVCKITVQDQNDDPVKGVEGTIVLIRSWYSDDELYINAPIRASDKYGYMGFSTSTNGTYVIEFTKEDYQDETIIVDVPDRETGESPVYVDLTMQRVTGEPTDEEPPASDDETPEDDTPTSPEGAEEDGTGSDGADADSSDGDDDTTASDSPDEQTDTTTVKFGDEDVTIEKEVKEEPIFALNSVNIIRVIGLLSLIVSAMLYRRDI